MAVTPPPTIDPAPEPAPQRGERATFADRVDAFITWLIAAVAQFGAVASNVFGNAQSAAADATAAATSAAFAEAVSGVTKWVSGTTYAQGACAWSPIDFRTYRRKIAGAGTTDPSADATNWLLLVASTGANSFTGPQNEAKGNNIASAATVDLTAATGNLVHITGTTSISAITLASGAERVVVFDGALTLVNGASLLLPGAADITTAAGDRATFRGDGAAVRCIHYTRADGQALRLAPVQHLLVRHELASGTHGGSANSSVWNVRSLNTVVDNSIAGASLASNQITLSAGTYRVKASAPTGDEVSGHQMALYNVTSGTNLLYGTTDSPSSRSFVEGTFVLASTSTLSLRHWIRGANGAETNQGACAQSGVNEIYTVAEFWRES